MAAVVPHVVPSVSCFTCNVELLEAKQRRRILGPSSGTVLEQLKDLGYAEIVATTVDDENQETYLCRKCFSQLEKRARLKEQLSEIDRDFRQKLQQKASTLTLQTSSHSTPTKRRHSREGTEGVSPRKRSGQSCTPVRRVVQQSMIRNSPAVTVVVKRPKSSSTHHLTSSLKKLGRSVGRWNPKANARQVMRHKKTKEAVVKETGLILRRELQMLCKKTAPSILRDTSLQALQRFSRDSLVDELKERSPTLYEVLSMCVTRKRRKWTKSKSYAVKDSTIIGMCAAIILCHRNIRMNLVQRVVSLILYSEHTTKQTFKRLQKLLVCLSHQRTLNTVDELGKDHDARVHEWKRKVNEVYTGADGPTDAECELNVLTERTCSAAEDLNVSLFNEPRYSIEGGPSSYASTCSSPEAPPYSPLSSFETISTTSGTSQRSTSQSEFEDSQHSSPETESNSQNPVYPTYKLVGDNLDKHVKPREMRSEVQAQSLHFFNTMAVRDRVDASNIEDNPSLPDLSFVRVQDILPTAEDHIAITDNFTILISRTLMKYMPFFNRFGSGLEKHIQHKFSKEMSQKSEVIPLGILLKSEVKHDDMISIMDTLQEYVPTTIVCSR